MATATLSQNDAMVTQDEWAAYERLVGMVALLEVKASKSASQTQNPLYLPVRLTKARSVYGRYEFLVEPVGGTGQQWISVARLDLSNPTPVKDFVMQLWTDVRKESSRGR